MLGKKLLATASGIAAITLSTAALADMSMPYGWYLEGNIGSTTLTNKDYATGASASTSGVGESAFVGYKFMPYFAAELSYQNYARSNIKNNSTDVKVARDRHDAIGFDFKGIIPFGTTGFEAFAKAGMARLSSSVSIQDASGASALGIVSGSHSATGLLLGAGAQFYFMPELAFVVQWTRADGNKNTGNLELISGGVNFIFG